MSTITVKGGTKLFSSWLGQTYSVLVLSPHSPVGGIFPLTAPWKATIDGILMSKTLGAGAMGHLRPSSASPNTAGFKSQPQAISKDAFLDFSIPGEPSQGFI